MSTPEIHTRAVPPFADASREELPTCARDRIFQAARLLFYRYGIRGVSVDQIAAEAKTTKVTLYRVFSSKDDLIVQVLEDQKRRFEEWWDSVIAPFEGNPRKQIEALFESLTDQVCAEEADRGCPVANAAVEIVDEDHPAKRIIDEHNHEIARRLRKLCKEMGAKNATELGDSLTLLVEGVFAARIVFHSGKLVESASRTAKILLDSAVLDAPVKKKK
jgi:AcrR family transcriptional regulator